MLGLTLLFGGLAHAGTVRGSVTLPEEQRSSRRFMGYWRVDNGGVPITPPSSRPEAVVVLTGAKGDAPSAKTVTVEIAGLLANPPTVIVGPGSVIEFRNSDRVPHDLGIPTDTNLMPVERLAPGALRRARFSRPGGYLVRCLEYPNVMVSVIVVDSPHFTTLDEKGQFKLPDVPNGKATLKIWSAGRFVHQQEIVVGSKGDLRIRVTAKEESNDVPGEEQSAPSGAPTD